MITTDAWVLELGPDGAVSALDTGGFKKDRDSIPAPPRIAVVGMAGRFPGAANVEAFWRDLREGVLRITRFTEAELRASGVPDEVLRDPAYVPAKGVLAGADRFDAAVFAMSPREAELTDPQHRVFLECALSALEDAGYAGGSSGQLTGVFAGCGASDHAGASAAAGAAGEYQRVLGSEKDFLATRVSYKLDLRGPSLTVQSACSTSLVAVGLACQSLLAYQCDVALAGAVAISLPLRAGYMHQPGMVLSPDGRCRPFDADAAGTIPGNGVGAVVLRRLEDALADGDTVLAVLCGFGLTNDGAAKQSFSAPSVDGQATAIAQALAMAGFDPATVSYVEAHGTGTPLGDPIEVAALTSAFRRGARSDACALGSVKASIGHLDAAAGIAGLIKVIQMLRHREIPPSLHVQRVSPRLDLGAVPFAIPTARRPWQAVGPRRAGVSSFGIGGTNAHVVLEEAPPAPPTEQSARPQLLTLSAATTSALEAVEAELAQHLAEHPDVMLADVAFTLHVGRRSHRHRRAIACADRAEAIAALADRSAGAWADAGETTPEVAFLFPGHGSGYPDMGRALYDAWPSFRADIDEGVALLRSRAGVDLRPALFPAAGERAKAAAAIGHAALGQPATFLVEWALGRLLLSWGVRPCAMLGHSLGEYAAACLAGVLSFEDALCLVAERGALIARAPEGAMLAVGLSPEELEPLLGDDLTIAAINGPARCVVAGPPAAVSALGRSLAGRGVESRSLDVPHAFHSRLMDGIIEPFVAALRRVSLRAPQIPLVSCITAASLTANEATDPSYWGRHLREPVRFEAALRRLCEAPSRILVEVGPGDTLTTLARRHPGISFSESMATLRRPTERRSEAAHLLETVGRLWVRDVGVELARLHDGERRRRVKLPTYPFEWRHSWHAPPAPAVQASASTPVATPGQRDVGSWFYRPVWRDAPPETPARIPAGEYLLFADAAGLAIEVKAALLSAGVTLVRPGDRFDCTDPGAYTLRPGVPADYAALLDALGQAGKLPDHVLHLWGVDDAEAPASAALDRGLLSVVRLLRALGSALDARPLRLLIVTRGAQPAGGAPVERPELAMALALARVVPDEYPHIRCGTVDLASADLSSHATGRMAGALLHELGLLHDARKTPAIAHRGTERLELTFEQERADDGPLGPAVRPRGACLITGGLGGIGLVLARHLAATPGARLVLLGRAGLPPRSLWADLLAESLAPEPDSTAWRIRAVLDLERAGAEVLVLAADVTCEPEMQRAIAATRARFGTIGGVVHAAGIAAGGAIQRQSEEELRAALAPKLEGTLLLAALTRDEPLELFVMCSSLTAIGGGFGQLAYSAANCFLDAFASSLCQRGVRAVSINWDGWAEVGMAARAARTLGAEAGRAGTKDHPLLGGRVLRTDSSALYRRRLDPARDWILNEHRLHGRPTVPGTAYIELARAVAAEQLGEGPLLLRDLTLLTPLGAADGEVLEVWTSARRTAAGLAIEVHGRVAGTEDPAQMHMQCTAARLDEDAPPPIAIESLREGCFGERAPEELRAAGRGVIDLGARWRCTRRLWIGPQHAAAELVAPDASEPDGIAYFLSPAVLDMAAGCAAHLVTGDLLPCSYGAIRIYGPLRGRVFSRARLVETSPRSSRFTVTVYDEHGAARVAIDDYFLLVARAPKP